MRTAGTRNGEAMQSMIVVARLKPGAEAEARELIEQGPPYDMAASGLTHHSVFLSADEVIFLFEGPDAERVVHGMVNDPVASAQFATWAHLIEGTPFFVRREFDWWAE